MITSEFIEDQTTANARIAQHETRLGLPNSTPLDDIARANLILRGLELMPTPVVAAVPSAPLPTTAPMGLGVSAPAATGLHRMANAFATSHPPARQAQSSTAPCADDGKLHGVSLLAAFYARHRQPSIVTA